MNGVGRTLTAAVIAGVIAAACGSDSDSSGTTAPAAPAPLRIGALDIDFDADGYTAPAGDVEMVLVQEGMLPHSLVVERVDGPDVSGRLDVAIDDVDDTTTFSLDAGEYVLYCDVVGHRAAGMEATLTIS